MIDLTYPKSPNGFIGDLQQRIAAALQQETPQTLMFLGPSGVGKTSLAQFAAYEVLRDVEVIHINCVDKSGVNDARQLGEGITTRSLMAQYKVYFLDEIHGWSGQAQEALLIRLEDLPPHVYIFAASTMPEKLKPTLVSRFTVHNLTSPSLREQAEWIKDTLAAAEIGITGYTKGTRMLSKDEANSVVYAAGGNIRRLKRLCAQVIDGTFTPTSATDEPTLSLVDTLLFGKGNPFAAHIPQPQQAVVGLCMYAGKILATNPSDQQALRILEIFGKGLPQGMPEIVGLWHLISLYLK